MVFGTFLGSIGVQRVLERGGAALRLRRKIVVFDSEISVYVCYNTVCRWTNMLYIIFYLNSEENFE
jgi:hypothetical protein